MISFNQDEKSQIVELHNDLRAKVASGNETRGLNGSQPRATNMKQLKWNDDLAEVAQDKNKIAICDLFRLLVLKDS